MIGGDDLILDVPWEAADRDRILGFFRHAWPGGRYADALSDYVGDIHAAVRTAPGTTEFFVYESEDARKEWAAEGATDANLDKMLYVIGNDTSITLVVGRAHGPLAALWSDLIDVILRNRFITEPPWGVAA